MLAVVECEHHGPLAQHVSERVEERTAVLFRHADHGRDAGDHEVRAGYLGQLDVAGPVRVIAGRHGERTQREAGLADAPGAGQRYHAGRAHEAAQLVELMLAADEAVGFGGEF
jgi:hypothetical protein